MSDSLQPQRRQPTRLSCPWDSPGKNTGVGCHFLLQCMKVKSENEVAQSCPTLRPHGLQPTKLLRPWDFPSKSHWGSPIISICFETTGFIYMNKNFHLILHFLFTIITIMLPGGFGVAAKNQSQANSCFPYMYHRSPPLNQQSFL